MPSHPLQPLVSSEIQTAVKLLQALTSFTPATRIISVMLKEPAKELVYAWPNGQIPDREAVAVLFDNAANAAVAATLNLTVGTVVKMEQAPAGAQPTLSMDEQVECEQAVLASKEFKAALEKHYGVTDTSLVMVDIWSAGNYGSEEDRTRRLTRPLCFLRSDATDNGYARPIEGIRPVVDLNLMQVIRVEQYGHWPLPPDDGNYAADRVPNQRKDIKPLVITQPEGPSYSLDGNLISWQNWEFVIGFNAREGLTIHDLRYADSGRKRPV